MHIKCISNASNYSISFESVVNLNRNARNEFREEQVNLDSDIETTFPLVSKKSPNVEAVTRLVFIRRFLSPAPGLMPESCTRALFVNARGEKWV